MTRDPRDIRSRLSGHLARARLRVGAAGLLTAAAVLLPWFGLTLLVLGRLDHVAVPLKVGAWLGLAAVGVLTVLDRLGLPLRDLGRLAGFTRRLDRAGGHRNLLVAAEEASRGEDRWRDDGVAGVLRERLQEDAARRLDDVKPGRLLGLPRPLPAAAACLAAAAALWLAWRELPAVFERGRARLAAPTHDEVWAPTAGLLLETREARVPARRSAQVTAVDLGHPRGPVVCEVRPEHGRWRPVPVTADTLGSTSPFRRYRAEIPVAGEDLRVRFRRDGMTTTEGLVTVMHPPVLTELALRLEPPAYTGLPAEDLMPPPPSLEAPAGSHLRWSGRANKVLAAATSMADDGAELPWTIRGDTLTLAWTADRDLAWRLRLDDVDGLQDLDPVHRMVHVLPDAPPTAWLRGETEGGRLPGDGRVLLQALGEDDYGVASLSLLVRREAAWGGAADTTWTRLPLDRADRLRADSPDGPVSAAAGDREGGPGAVRWSQALLLETAELELMPGDALLLAAEAVDNRRPGPAARARSKVIRLELPSAADLLTEQVADEDDRLDDLDALRRRGDSMREELARLERELKKDADLDFARKQELEDALARQEALREEVERIADAMQQDIGELMEHNAASQELLERMEQVSQLLQEVQSEELKRLQDQLRQAMDQLSEEEIRAAMEDVAKNQQEFLEKLDRAIAQLEEMKRAQEMARMTSEVEDLMREQQALLDQDQDAAAEAERQDALARAAEEMKEQLREALERLESGSQDSPATDAMEEALREALEAMEQSDPAEAMREAAEAMREQESGESGESQSGESRQDRSQQEQQEGGQESQSQSSESPSQESPPSGGQQQQHEALRRLASLYHIMMQGQGAMQMAMDQHVADALRGLAFDLLDISRRQEALALAVPQDLRDVRAPELARDQMTVLRGTAALRDRLTEILQKSSTLNFQLLNNLDAITEKQDEALGHLEVGWGGPAATAARDGLAAVNQLVVNLLTAAQMTGGGGGGSCPTPSLSMQLEQMAREQAGLNGLTQQMQGQMGQGGLSQQQRAQMQRLQSDQQGLAGQMQDAAREREQSEDRERLLGDLDQLARDMERVADDLGAGRVDEETLRRQERILSRLLDARNSVRRRDYSKRRESETAEGLFRVQRGELPPPDAAADDVHRLRRDQVDHVPGDYRDLVRRYFRALDELEGGAKPEGGTP